MSTDKKLIVVFGITGIQGGSVANSILNDPKASAQFQLRGITRNTSSESAKALIEKGVELVTADLDDVESLRHALKDAYGVFLVTNYWEHFSEVKEEQQGKNVVDVAKELGVQHFVFSSLHNVNEHTKGALPNVYHFDGKARIEQYARDSGIPSTFFYAGAYMSNFHDPKGVMTWRKNEEGVFIASAPLKETATLPLFDTAADTGKFVKGIFLKRDQVLGKRVYGHWKQHSYKDLLKEFEIASGEKAKLVTVSDEDFKNTLLSLSLPDRIAQEVWENMRWIEDYGYFGGDKEVEKWSLGIPDEPLTTWVDYLKKTQFWKQ